MLYRMLKNKVLPDIRVCADQDETALTAARYISEFVTVSPQAKITYATGNTMIPVYANLQQMVAEKTVSFAETTAFHLDEYYPCEPSAPHSFVQFLRQRVFAPLEIKTEHIFELRGDNSDPQTTAKEYDTLITKKGIDLAILGIGPGCHIGFNERGTSFTSRTHVADLSKGTIERDHKDRQQETPSQALTQGIGTILESGEIILIAYGKEKGRYLKEMLDGPVTENCPASALRTVPQKVKLFIDESAAAAIEES